MNYEMSEYLPARRVVKRTGRSSMRGYFQSQKMGRSIECESKLEMDAARHFEIMPWVEKFKEQPVTIEFYMEGKLHKYTPDFALMVSHQKRSVHAEIKSERQLKTLKLRNRLAHIAKHYENHTDIDFIVLSERDIHKEPMLSNIRLLHYHHRWSLDDPELIEALGKLSLLPPKTVAGANAVLGNDYAIYRLLAVGAYLFDVDQMLTAESAIYPAGGHHV